MAADIDRNAFMLGMITAFAECVGQECKRAALSSPFYPEDLAAVKEASERIAAEQGVHLWLDENKDIPAEGRLLWYLIYKFPEVREQYIRLRRDGANPAWDFGRFRDFLSYGTAWGRGAEQVEPRMREARPTLDSVARVLLRPGEWPPPKA